MGPGSNRKRAGMVALAICLLAFAPAATAVASASGPTVWHSNPSEPVESATRPAASHSNDVETNSQRLDAEDGAVGHHFFVGRGDMEQGDGDRSPSDPPAAERSNQDDQGREPPGNTGPATTTTTTTQPATTEPSPSPTTTTIPPPAVPTTQASPTTTLPTPSSTAAPDDGRSNDGAVGKTPGSVGKPPTGGDAVRPDPLLSEPVEPPVVEPGVSSDTVVRTRAAIDWSFLSGEETLPIEREEPTGAVESESESPTVVLSWLLERDASSPSMTMLSPIVVLLTIWDAAASAGSGLAAPASGLGTLVLLILVEKGHLANGARLVRRRIEA